MKANDFRHDAGPLTIHLAREFGFCYGVDRAVDYAYQARKRFADRRVYLTGEIIHNPHVNEKLRAAGHPLPLATPARTRPASAPTTSSSCPAFGVTVAELRVAAGARLHPGRHHLRLGAERVEERHPLRAGGLHRGHPRQVPPRGDPRHRVAGAQGAGRPLSRGVRSRRGGARLRLHPRHRATATTFVAHFAKAVVARLRSGSRSDRASVCANQTTMLMSESLAIGEMFRQAMVDRYGDAALADHYPRVRHHLLARRRSARTRSTSCSPPSGST